MQVNSTRVCESSLLSNHQKQTNMNKYQNIPDTGFTTSDNVSKQEYASVVMNQSGFFTLSLFSIVQIIFGVKVIANGKFTARIAAGLVAKLFEYSLQLNGDDKTKVELTREEVRTCVQLLDARMNHCQQERDEKKDSFNPDTYIAQKLLLIEMKEWLLCEAVAI